MSIELIATTAFGLEKVAQRELEHLGYKESYTENGKITFAADLEAIPRTNLWLRSADRIFLKLGSFPAGTFDDLYEGVKSLPWQLFLDKKARFPVEARIFQSTLSSEPAVQRMVKKAIADHMAKAYGNPWSPETGANYPVEIHLHKDVATLAIDTSGQALHKRGYRTESAIAPLKETLAAALVLLSWWRPNRPLIDPFCGSGTIPIEAAMIAANQAPGLQRSFVSESWPALPSKFWQLAQEEAQDSKLKIPENRIVGTDIDPNMIRIAKTHAHQAGVANLIRFDRLDVRHFHSDEAYSCVVTNPPYGERLNDPKELLQLHRDLGRLYTTHKNTWSFFVLTPNNIEREFKKPATKRRKLYNGRIQCTYYQYLGPLPPKEPTNP